MAPRDKVILEAGYFAAAKGKERTLIIRQKGAKMPADLGGDIYAPLLDPDDTNPVRGTSTASYCTVSDPAAPALILAPRPLTRSFNSPSEAPEAPTVR